MEWLVDSPENPYQIVNASISITDFPRYAAVALLFEVTLVMLTLLSRMYFC